MECRLWLVRNESEIVSFDTLKTVHKEYKTAGKGQSRITCAYLVVSWLLTRVLAASISSLRRSSLSIHNIRSTSCLSFTRVTTLLQQSRFYRYQHWCVCFLCVLEFVSGDKNSSVGKGKLFLSHQNNRPGRK
jgi:hypothetical protein